VHIAVPCIEENILYGTTCIVNWKLCRCTTVQTCRKLAASIVSCIFTSNKKNDRDLSVEGTRIVQLLKKLGSVIYGSQVRASLPAGRFSSMDL